MQERTQPDTSATPAAPAHGGATAAASAPASGAHQKQPLLRLRGVVREYPAGNDVVAVLKDVDLDIYAGEMVAIIGPSGSGKSTLMNILGCLDRPTRGSYEVSGKETRQMAPDELARLRREHFGFIFQRYHLMGDLNAMGNAEIPAIYAGVAAAERHAHPPTDVVADGTGSLVLQLAQLVSRLPIARLEGKVLGAFLAARLEAIRSSLPP